MLFQELFECFVFHLGVLEPSWGLSREIFWICLSAVSRDKSAILQIIWNPFQRCECNTVLKSCSIDISVLELFEGRFRGYLSTSSNLLENCSRFI